MTLLLSSKLPAVIVQYRAFPEVFFFFLLHFYMHSNRCTVGNLIDNQT